MLLHTGVGNAETSHLQNCSVKIFKEHCRYFTMITNFLNPNLQQEIIKNQRANGPVNTHLVSVPNISTKTSFAKFDIVVK